MAQKLLYPPEMIAKWAKELRSGDVTKEGIMARHGINRVELNRRLAKLKVRKE